MNRETDLEFWATTCLYFTCYVYLGIASKAFKSERAKTVSLALGQRLAGSTILANKRIARILLVLALLTVGDGCCSNDTANEIHVLLLLSRV